MSSNEILVAGMHMPDNQFTRFVLSYGFKVTHRPDSESNREIPVTGGALICTSQISHPFRNRVIEAYKMRNLPWLETRSDSTSEIKEKFEQTFVKPVAEKLGKFSSMEEQLIFFIMYFNNIGAKIRSSDITEKMRKYIPTLTDAYANAVYSKLGAKGILEKMNGSGSRGMWKVRGIPEKQYLGLSAKYGAMLPTSWKSEEKPTINIDLMTNEEIARQQLPQPPQPQIEEVRKELEEFKAEQTKAFNNFTGSISVQVQSMVRAVERMSLTVNRDSKEAMIQDITNKLSTMSVQEILKFKTIMDIWSK